MHHAPSLIDTRLGTVRSTDPEERILAYVWNNVPNLAARVTLRTRPDNPGLSSHKLYYAHCRASYPARLIWY